jgi:hypothetical protein
MWVLNPMQILNRVHFLQNIKDEMDVNMEIKVLMVVAGVEEVEF